MNSQLSLSGTRLRSIDLLPPETDGAVVTGADENRALAIRLLNDALVIARGVRARCERQYYSALRLPSPALAAAALEHDHDARLQTESLDARIAALGGSAAPASGSDAPATPPDAGDADSFAAVVGGFLAAERAAIESYRQVATRLAPCDRATQALLESIVSGEEAQAARLAAMLERAAAHAAKFAQNLPWTGTDP